MKQITLTLLLLLAILGCDGKKLPHRDKSMNRLCTDQPHPAAYVYYYGERPERAKDVKYYPTSAAAEERSKRDGCVIARDVNSSLVACCPG